MLKFSTSHTHTHTLNSHLCERSRASWGGRGGACLSSATWGGTTGRTPCRSAETAQKTRLRFPGTPGRSPSCRRRPPYFDPGRRRPAFLRRGRVVCCCRSLNLRADDRLRQRPHGGLQLTTHMKTVPAEIMYNKDLQGCVIPVYDGYIKHSHELRSLKKNNKPSGGRRQQVRSFFLKVIDWKKIISLGFVPAGIWYSCM